MYKFGRCRALLGFAPRTVVFATALSIPAIAANLCVNPGGTGACYSSIQTAVNHAAANDTINVAAGTYHEGVVIGKPLSLLGAGAGSSIIDGTNKINGVL